MSAGSIRRRKGAAVLRHTGTEAGSFFLAGYFRGVVLASVGLCLLLVACSGSAERNAPVEVVRQFVAASEARDLNAMLELVEPVEWRKQIVPELQQALAQIEGLSYAEQRFDLLDNENDLAHVRFQGVVMIDLRGRDPLPPRTLDQTFELVRLEGRWYIRGLTLPLPEGE